MPGDVRPLDPDDRGPAYAVINAAAERYRGLIPEAADTRPYMPRAELDAAFDEMAFYGVDRDGLAGVIGLQDRDDATLIRHLYVRPADQRQGLGTTLLEAALDRASTDRVLVGTWAAAEWAIDFYQQHGFERVDDTDRLLQEYWNVPAHQREASVVLRYEPEA